MADTKISALSAVTTVVPNTDVLPLVSGGSTTKATPTQVVSAVLNTGTAITIGPITAANTTRFANSLTISSKITGASNLAVTESHNIGVVGEALAHATNTAIYGIGVYGVGYTQAATRCAGVVGEGHVNATADTGASIGVRGYANDTHAGGQNIGLYGDATGSTLAAGTTGNNLSLYLNNGDIWSTGTKTWYLNGNLTFTNAFTVKVPNLATTAPSTINAATYTVSGSDSSLIFTTTACTVTLPTASSFPGRILYIKNITATAIISAASNVYPIATAVLGNSLLTATAGKFAMIQSDGTNWVTMMAN
jgi:hypothetical protein